MNERKSFLSILYFEKFKNSNRETYLMSKTDFKTEENIRNDQSISECRQNGKMLDELIERYLDIFYA